MKTIKEYVRDVELFEKQEYEYKLQLNREEPVKWVKTIVAFANEGGGKLYIGVTNEGYAKGFEESEVDNEQKYFVDFIKNKVYPRIHYDVNYITTEENTIVIEITVYEYKGDVVCYIDENGNDRLFRRSPGSTYEVTKVREMGHYAIEKQEISYDTFSTKYKSKDFSFNYLNELYKDERHTQNDITEKQLNSIQLIDDDGFLTYAGLLFVDEHPYEFPAIHMRKWPGFNKGSDEVIDAKEFRGNLLKQLEVATKFIRNNSKTGIIKRPNGALDVWSYPSIAITEALCNAIIHRDYLIRGTQIDVDIYQDRIVIVSPGSFLPEGKAQEYEDITKIPSKRRNEAITNTFAFCNLVQRYGSGFEKIVEAYENYDKKYQPKISSTAGWFTITLMDVTYKEENNVVSIVSEVNLPKNQKIVYDTILNNLGLRIPALSEICGLKETSVDNAIRKLKELTLIEYRGASRDGGYFIYSKSTD